MKHMAAAAGFPVEAQCVAFSGSGGGGGGAMSEDDL